LLKEAAKREIGSIAHKLLQDSQNPSPDLDLGLMTSKAAQDMRAASDRSGANMWLDSGQVLLDVANGDMPVKILDFHFPALPMLMSDRKPLAGHLWIVAGAFKSGKTTLALNLLCGMLEAGHQVGVVSLEMTPAEYSLAALAIMTDTPLQLDSLTDEHRAIIANFAQTDGRTFKVRQIGKNNWAGIEAAIRKLHSDAITAGRPLSVVLVDHLGLAQSDDPRLNELQAKKEIADACKRVAMELGILVILLAQMNKEGVRSSNPDASHITGLVGIPAVANVVLGINIPDGWEADDKPMFRVATLAHRNGPAGRYATYHRTEAGKMILVGEFPY
jgi:replicative DNA helicase